MGRILSKVNTTVQLNTPIADRSAFISGIRWHSKDHFKSIFSDSSILLNSWTATLNLMVLATRTLQFCFSCILAISFSFFVLSNFLKISPTRTVEMAGQRK